MSDFKAALPKVIKWSVGENQFDEDGKNPKSLSLFIPKESIAAFASYLTALSGDTSKIKTGKVWDYENQKEVELDGFYLNAKGRTGQYGDFGNINPVRLESNPPTQAADNTDIPF